MRVIKAPSFSPGSPNPGAAQVVVDGWQLLAAGEAVPESGDVIVPALVWNAERARVSARAGKVGVWLKSDELPELIEALSELPLVAIDFPKFGDGRGYTSARLLRERHRYEGEVRAVGEVLRDQLFYMARCGFDSFALKAGKDIEGALEAFKDFSVSYQPAADDPRPLFRRVSR
jgi:uncharacterized protein (DUF934 family)